MMTKFYKLRKILLGDTQPLQSGHLVYTNAQYQQTSTSPKKIIYKINKEGNKNNSHFEVAFSGLAQLFLQPKLTARQYLVRNTAIKIPFITGLASEHLCYNIAARESQEQFFYKLDPQQRLGIGEKLTVQEHPENIPVYFFNQLPNNFFTRLMRLLKEQNISFNMDSLASVLTTSYTLEEDDLHKGNFGFYITEQNHIPHLVFFKIDHDLMLADSVTSFGNARFFNWRLGGHAFEVTERDLINFPLLLDSQNHYWPTCHRFFANPWDPKNYSDQEEVAAFASLSELESFQRAKWRAFYKHLLITPAQIRLSLVNGFDPNDALQRAQIALVSNAVVARQARLQAVLFSIPTFRAFVRNLSAEKKQEIIAEIIDAESENKANVAVQLQTLINQQQQFCQDDSEGLQPGDTPLHVAIRLGNYRYHETWESFGHFINQKNDRGETPLDVAIKSINHPTHTSTFFSADKNSDPRADGYFIAKHLIQNGAKPTYFYQSLSAAFKNKIAHYHFPTAYIDAASQANNYAQLLPIFKQMGEDERYALKMKKELALECLNVFIHHYRGEPEQLNAVLTQFKQALNGYQEISPVSELQFIRQLRSRLWIVRQIRGLLGGTATQVAMNKLIDERLSDVKLAATEFTFCVSSGF